ncbi:hypothetical protein [Rhodanobacter sp. L36]|uniref:hypothetical protein n=1 Tax=Rhodanobacter sp. L36 TaxID=1747221 RepID=UPI00131E27FC|nr:hypothetical protein [Rhodanobacter sp. L36]
MFGLFKKKPVAQAEVAGRKPRGVLPTYVTDTMVVLSKASPAVRNTYEIRLALYMAKSRNLRFLLAVRPGAKVEASVRQLLGEQGAAIEESQLDDYCVSLGWGFEEGEREGWVLGDTAAFNALVKELESSDLKALLRVGASLSGSQLDTVIASLANEKTTVLNIDGERVIEAMLVLATDARKNGGIFFVQ